MSFQKLSALIALMVFASHGAVAAPQNFQEFRVPVPAHNGPIAQSPQLFQESPMPVPDQESQWMYCEENVEI